MRNLSITFGRWFSLFVVLLLATTTTSAQEANPPAPFDARDFATRYHAFAGHPPIPPLTPIFEPGATAQFWVSRAGDAAPTRVDAHLIAATANVYLWVEDGIRFTGSMTDAARQIDQIFAILQRRDNYRPRLTIEGLGEVADPTDRIPIPDADNDPHLYILFSRDLSAGSPVVINPLDSLPVEYAPYSNQHELLYVDTSQFGTTALSDPAYLSAIMRGIYRWLMLSDVPTQAAWLTDALGWAILFRMQNARVDDGNILAYLQAPNTPLFQPETLATRTQTLGGQQLLLAYFVQRYGEMPFLDLFAQTSVGIAPLDAVLNAHALIDPATGAPITARDTFADFVMTNALNLPFGDGRYVHTRIPLPQNTIYAAAPLTLGEPLGAMTVNQFGAQVFRYRAPQDSILAIRFDGAETAARLPMPASTGDAFYWAQGIPGTTAALTRTVDLTDVTEARLSFSVWHDLAPGWNYGYVTVSTDSGASWTPLATDSTTRSNPHGAAYGAGFTGISNPQPPRPFPALGVVISGDGVTITDVTPSGAAAEAGILPGDIIVGYDGEVWQQMPNLLALLARYAPGDTLNLYIQRDTDRFDVPVVLGAHPTRIVEPEPLWLPQSVDLTPYAGQSILLRFERVTLPGYPDSGIALDDIRIDAIGFWDDGTSAAWDQTGWRSSGWRQTANTVPQQWIVQAATGGTQTKLPRVQHLIAPDDPATSGEWQIPLAQGETLLITVSAANDDSTQPAAFTLAVE